MLRFRVTVPSPIPCDAPVTSTTESVKSISTLIAPIKADLAILGNLPKPPLYLPFRSPLSSHPVSPSLRDSMNAARPVAELGRVQTSRPHRIFSTGPRTTSPQSTVAELGRVQTFLRPLSTAALVALFILHPSSFILRAAQPLNVASAAINLEADDSMILGGSILPKYAKGQEGELRAVATILEKPGSPRVAIVACDVLFLPRDLVDTALTRIERSTGLSPSNILVNATHTHHAPATGTVHGYARDEIFCNRVVDGIVLAVEQANNTLTTDGDRAACNFLFHLGEENTVGGNSRLLLPGGLISWSGPKEDASQATGPFDPELPVLAFRGRAHEYRALLYNHSTHTIGTRLGQVRSPSFYGLAAQELERDLGIEGAVTFLEGASGSTHNVTRVPVKTAVLRMKDAVRTALDNATIHPVTRLASVKRPFTFKIRTFDERTENEKVVTYCEERIPTHAESTVKVFRDMRQLLAPQQGQQRETSLQVILIGDVAIVGVPAEYFTVLGLDIKKRSPYPNTYIAELANDWIGYLPDREAHELGGYQTWTGLHSYAEPGTGEAIADEVISMLNEIKSQTQPPISK